MSVAKPKFVPDTRIWNAYQVASRLGWSESKLRTNRAALLAAGFPQRDDFLGGWDGNAIEAWIDRRSRLTVAVDDIDPFLEVLHGTA